MKNLLVVCLFIFAGFVIAEEGENTPSESKETKVEQRRDLVLEKPFLHLPVKTGAPETWVRVETGGDIVREFIIELTENSSEASFHAMLDLSAWQGQSVTLIAESVPEGSSPLAAITQSDTFPDLDTAYKEKYRPQFHFSPRRGWMNDPNGLVFFDGEYHLFYQHNPFGVRWNNMTWGHAVSRDLFHWQELGDVLYPDRLGTIFSGSAVVDWKNSSGLQTGETPPLVALYTYEGACMRYGEPASQAAAVSNDRGRTWIKYKNNPVIPHVIGRNRDPKVFWYEPTARWIMALYMDKENYALFESENLKEWTKLCDILNLGCSECPDMFELPVDGDMQNCKWVFWGGNGKYLTGTFDGKKFTPETEPLNMKWGGNDYAAQTYSDTPGRRIQFSWMNNSPFPGMPFNQQYTVPRELSLVTTPEGIRLSVYPVKELETLRGEPLSENKIQLSGTNIITLPDSELLDMEMVFQTGDAERVEALVHGHKIILLPREKSFLVDDVRAPVLIKDGRVSLRVVLDRMSLEVFVQGGLSQIAQSFVPNEGQKYDCMEISTTGTGAILESLTAWPLHPVW